MPEPVRRADAYALRRLSSHSWGPILIVGYFAIQALGRVLVSPALELDEAEQVLAAQQLSLGYGPQPPLYTWLQMGVFWLLGEGIPALTILKNTLLALAALLVFMIARRVIADPAIAHLAALSLFLLPPFAWEAQRDLSHSVLALAATAGAVLACLRMLTLGRRRDYALFGAAVAACGLSKYNAALLPVTLAVVALIMPRLRSWIASDRFAIALGLALVLILPHAIWAIAHPTELLADIHKFNRLQQADPGAGLLSFASAVFGVIGPAVLVFGIASIRRPTSSRRGTDRPLSILLLIRAVALALGLVLALVILLDVGEVKERWLLPALFLVPAIITIDQGATLGRTRVRLLTRLVGGLALFVLVVLIARAPLGPMLGDPNRLNFPGPEIASQIRAEAVPDLILSANRDLGGNLRLAFPKTPVVVPALIPPPAPRSGCWLLVWESEAGDAPPAVMTTILASLTDGGAMPPVTPGQYAAPLLYSDDTMATINAVWLRIRADATRPAKIRVGCQ